MTEQKAPAKSRRGKFAATPPAPVIEAPIAAVAQVVPSSPELIALGRLRRATENVRHTRIDEDVPALADDIAAHGLLSSLIGYAGSWPEDNGRVFIVGGGRRLQALQLLRERGALDDDFAVPVLIRDAEQAIELSLAENLQQRTMSPVDEFVAFKALMDTGHHSPAGLAKRFGFSERIVRQRLRLADLAPPVLDALAGREITIDAAMAYAATADQERQAKVFAAHAKNPYRNHEPRHIRNDLAQRTMSTADPLFRFVGESIYESRGGEYEDDLFNEGSADRLLLTPSILVSAAGEMAEFQSIGLVTTLRESEDWAPTIDGHVLVPGLRLQSWGVSEKPKAPAGFALIDRYDHQAVWRTIRNNGIPARIVVGINPDGALTPWPRLVLVPEAQKQAVDPNQQLPTRAPETAAQRAARERAEGVAVFARRLAVGPFAGTPFEGRAFWPDRWEASERQGEIDGIPGWFVPVKIFVSEAGVAAQLDAAEQAYDQHLVAEQAKKDAAEAQQAQRHALDKQRQASRRAELVTMDPPAVVVIDGEPWARAEDGSYSPIDDLQDGYVDAWLQLLDYFGVDEFDSTFGTRAEFDEALAAATASPQANDDDALDQAEAAE